MYLGVMHSGESKDCGVILNFHVKTGQAEKYAGPPAGIEAT